MPRWQVTMTFFAADRQEALEILTNPERMRRDATMRIVNANDRLTLKHYILFSPLAIAVIIMAYKAAGAYFGG